MTKKSIVLVTVDCMRADHAGFMGYSRRTTPFLDSLASESFVFPAAIVAGAPTYYSLPALLASRHALALGRDVVGIAPEEPTLASVFKQAEYATAAFGAGNPYLSSRFGYEQGFGTFRDFLESESQAQSGDTAKSVSGNGWASRLNRKLQQARPRLGRLGILYDELYFQYCQRRAPVANSLDALRRFPAADVIVDHACTWLASAGDAPVFLWLHLMDPHSPYYPQEEALTLLGDSPLAPSRARYLNAYWNRSDLGPRRLARHREEVVRLYDAGIRWVDAQLARLIDRLRGSNRWEDCVFVLSADHGEEFLDHDGRYHPPSRLMEELIRVPLLLRVPGSAKKEVPNTPFSLLDLAPTLLDAVGLRAPSSFRGVSRWPDVRAGTTSESVAITECVAGCMNPLRTRDRLRARVLSIRERRFKLVLYFDQRCERLYDLEADPGEQVPLAPGAQNAVRRRLLEIAREHLRRSSDWHSSPERVRARLRDLRLEWASPQPSLRTE